MSLTQHHFRPHQQVCYEKATLLRHAYYLVSCMQTFAKFTKSMHSMASVLLEPPVAIVCLLATMVIQKVATLPCLLAEQ
jgi:hypothetical protein